MKMVAVCIPEPQDHEGDVLRHRVYTIVWNKVQKHLNIKNKYGKNGTP